MILLYRELFVIICHVDLYLIPCRDIHHYNIKLMFEDEGIEMDADVFVNDIDDVDYSRFNKEFEDDSSSEMAEQLGY